MSRDLLRVSFHGAAGGVTGSCHLLEASGLKILIDCGAFQGGRDLDEENEEPFDFEPSEIDFLLLTHAHLDHCGRVPLLVKRGFQGEIVATAATRELARLVMLDSGYLHEEEAERRARWHRRRDREPPTPLFTTLDALNSLDCFGRIARYGETIELSDGVRVTFRDAGHILGSSFVVLEVGQGAAGRRLVFSGDLGSADRPILRDPAAPPAADYVIMESTYGDRVHKSLEASVAELYETIRDVFGRGGNVLIPSFAVERAQEVLYFLREGVGAGELPRSMQVFLDSPMAISATEIFRRHPECYDEAAAALFEQHRDPFGLPGLHMTRTAEDSRSINRFMGNTVIIAGSGMCTGGRIRHHLKHNLSRKRSGVVFVGFAAPRTLARRLIDGAREVHIFGEAIPVQASIHTINGFSAHADRTELLGWHRHTGQPRTTFLVHGDPERGMLALASALEDGGSRVVRPQRGEAHDLTG